MRRDPRLTPARLDLAAASLQGQVEAARFVAGVRRRVMAPVAPVRRAPTCDAPLDTEALRGETMMVYDQDEEGWSWGQLDRDGYVGYLPTEALVAEGPVPTHEVRALRTFVYPGADMKLPPREALAFGCAVTVRGQAGGFALTAHGAVFAAHLAPIGAWEPDFVAVAERFLETPYLWGGRSAFGLDCSGLVQTALAACGVAAPRDSDQQEAGLGTPLALTAPFQRGDLVFWPGHVGIVTAPDTLLHANAHHMRVAREPLHEARARLAAMGIELRAACRLAPAS